MIERLGRLSVYDCMGMIGRLSMALEASGRPMEPAAQLRLVDWLAKDADPDLHRRLSDVVRRGPVAICEQELVHLARMVLIHASPRKPNGFNAPTARDFLACLFRGVPDLLQATKGELENRHTRLSWTLRQCGMNRGQERLPLWSTYFEVFRRIWPALDAPGTPDADSAFLRYVGLSIEQFMSVGFAVSAAFAGEDGDGLGASGALRPSEYFATTAFDSSTVEAFLGATAATLEDLRERIAAEDAQWGPTTFGSLAIEKTPLLRGPSGECYLVSAGALDRRVTHGILHSLAEGSVGAGLDREHFTSPFGAAFQVWVERALRRGIAGSASPPEIFIDEDYGTKRLPRRTPDIVLRYPRALVLVEVVAGPMRAQTITRGDLDAFDRDFDKLVRKKAEQLSKRGVEILNGDAERIGLAATGVTAVWPVIVSATPFPHRPEIGREVRQRLRAEGLFKDRRFRSIAIVSAEELAAAEGAMEEGASFLTLISEWKATPAVGDHSFKNFLIDREIHRKRMPAKHHVAMFDEACDVMLGHVFAAGATP